MKFLGKVISLVISFSLAIGLLTLLINDTFTKTELQGIPIPRFLYLKDNSSLNYELYTFRKNTLLNETKNNYLKNLENCYGNYYYDQNNELTITKYEIIPHQFYQEVKINIDYKNYCSENYILSDTWLDEQKTVPRLMDLNISINNFNNLLDKISEAKRDLEPIINPSYHSEYIITYNYYLLNNHYYMEIKDINENEIVVIKTLNEESKFAVYEINTVKDYLKTIVE